MAKGAASKNSIPSSPLDLSSFNSAQREAVLCTEGPLLVLAGAGSGKTRVLTHRIAHLVADLGVPPWRILAITFTNKAAAEMRERLAALLPASMRGMWICTFHSMCVRILREDADLLGYTSQFSIYDDDDSRRLVRDIMLAFDLDQKQFPLNRVRAKISTAKNALISPEELLAHASSPPEQAVARVYVELDRRLRAANAMDFDDLLIRTLELLRTRPEVLRRYQERFRYILVDEYQDTNHVQYLLAHVLAATHHNLMVVGDDDQSIYSWRGADINNILDFEKDFPAAKVIKLEENYRSTGHILSAANAVVRHNSQRKDKRLFTSAGQGAHICAYQASNERDEGVWVGNEILRLRHEGMHYDDIAVFYRTNAQSRVLEDAFLRAGVPYRIVGGTRFFDRAEIRDVMAYLKMVLNPADEVSVKRILNTPRRGIGSTSLEKLERLAAQQHVSFFQALELAQVETALFSSKVRSALGEFTQAVYAARRFEGSLSELVEHIVERSGLQEALRAEATVEAESRLENIQEFLSVAAEFEEDHTDIAATLESLSELRAAGVIDAASATGPSVVERRLPQHEIEQSYGKLACSALIALMEWLALRSDLDALGEGVSAVTMMTIHSAKGLEFPAVFVTGMEEGIFPHVHTFLESESAKIEEERRLAYVAITRARAKLFLSYAATRRVFGSMRANPRSRFLDEIPEDDIEFTGVGSAGFYGTGQEKRGDRHGSYGVVGEEYGGELFGHYTRSTGVERRRAISPHAGLQPRSKKPAHSERPSAPTQRTPDVARAHTQLSQGDRISHKTFGLGEVLSDDGDIVEVRFDKSGQVKKLKKGFAPIVKLS